MYLEERINLIMNELEKNGEINVAELSNKFGFSKETIHRDLTKLEKEGRLKRTHGGAIPLPVQRNKNTEAIPLVLNSSSDKKVILSEIDGPLQEAPAEIRYNIHSEEKTAIGKKAAEMLKDGDTIFIDNSTTCEYMYPFIPKDLNITIITNSLQLLTRCATDSRGSNHTLICLDGILKESNLSVYGNITTENAREYFPNKAFVSCTGIVSKEQVTDLGVQEVSIKRMLIKTSRKVYLLVDNSKFQPAGQVYLGTWNDFDYVITDRKANWDYLNFSTDETSKIIIAD